MSGLCVERALFGSGGLSYICGVVRECVCFGFELTFELIIRCLYSYSAENRRNSKVRPEGWLFFKDSFGGPDFGYHGRKSKERSGLEDWIIITIVIAFLLAPTESLYGTIA